MGVGLEVSLRRCQVRVPEQFLNFPHIYTAFSQPTSAFVTQVVPVQIAILPRLAVVYARQFKHGDPGGAEVLYVSTALVTVGVTVDAPYGPPKTRAI
jgi:hypothetical protein